MTWFFLSLISPFLYSVTNHIDKHLLSKYFKIGGVGTLILISSLFSIFAVPVIYLIDPSVTAVSGTNIFILAFVGLLDLSVIYFYLLALKDDEPTVAIVFYQLVPVLGLIFGYFILDEVITKTQFIAMMIIILGTSIVAFEIDPENNFKLRWKTAGFMVAACTAWALQSVVLKAVALEETLWRSLFWKYTVMLVIGMLIFIFVTSYRTHFISALQNNSKAVLSLNFTNELLYIIGAIIAAFAAMLAPIALVLLANSFQPIFVLMIGVFLTLFFPHISSEKIEKKHIIQKFLAILITLIGTYILLNSGVNNLAH